MPRSPINLIFQIDLAAWKRIPRLEAQLQKAARMALDHLPKKFRFSATVNVLLTGNAKIRQLNHDFRGISKPTNVLSFPQYEPAELTR
jgi:probable rRNA maturation factor